VSEGVAGPLLYLRSRRVVTHGLALVCLTVVMHVTSSITLQLPSSTTSGYVVAPLWVFFPLVLAASVVASTDTDMADLECASGNWLGPARTVHLSVGAALAIALSALPFLVSGRPAMAGVAARNFLIWWGVALAASRFLRPSLAWVPPVVVSLLVNWFGHVTAGQAQAWAISELPASDGISWLGATGSVLTGGSMLAITRWRIYAWRTFVTQRLSHRRAATPVTAATVDRAVEPVQDGPSPQRDDSTSGHNTKSRPTSAGDIAEW
jgi:hypothetical protein